MKEGRNAHSRCTDGVKDFTLSAPNATDSASGTVRGTYSSRSTGGVPLSNAGSTIGVSTASTAATSQAPSSTLRNATNSSATKSSGGGKFAKIKAVPRKAAHEKVEESSDDESDNFVLSDSE